MTDSKKLSFRKDLKGLSKDAVIYGLSSAVGRMVHVLLAPILTRIFAPDDYGVISLIQVAISFFVIIAGANIVSGMSFYYYKFDEEEEREKALGTGILVVLFFSVFVAGILYLFAPEIAALLESRPVEAEKTYHLEIYLKIASLGLFFSLLGSLLQTILRLMREPFKFFAVEMVRVGVHFIAVIILVIVLKKGIEGVFWAGVWAPLVSLCLGFFFVRTRVSWVVSMPILWLILAYCIPQFPSVLINWGQSQLGRLFLNYHVPLNELGLYSIAFTIASIFMLFVTAFRMAFSPYALSIMKSFDAPRLYARFYLLYGIGFGCLLGIVNAFAKPILMLMAPPSYHGAYNLVVFFLVGHFFMGINNILGIGISITRRTIFISYAQFFAFAVFMVSNIFLVPPFGPIGAAIAFMNGAFVQSLACYYFAQKLWPVNYSFGRVNLLVLVLFIIGIAHNSLLPTADMLHALVWSFITSLVTVIVCLFFAYPDFLEPMVKKLGIARKNSF